MHNAHTTIHHHHLFTLCHPLFLSRPSACKDILIRGRGWGDEDNFGQDNPLPSWLPLGRSCKPHQ